MQEKVTLEILAYLITGSMLWLTLLWGFTYIIIIRKFETVFTMFENLAQGLSGQHEELGHNQINIHKDLSSQYKKLAKSVEEEEEINENDYN